MFTRLFILLYFQIALQLIESAFGVRDYCLRGPDMGDCKALMQHWYYDRHHKDCVHFIYGGCGGNSNNFKSKHDCRQSCGVPKNFHSLKSHNDKLVGTENCLLAADPGGCAHHIELWHYDSYDNDCKTFIYNGCGGNANKFATKSLCEKYCIKKSGLPIKSAGLLPDSITGLNGYDYIEKDFDFRESAEESESFELDFVEDVQKDRHKKSNRQRRQHKTKQMDPTSDESADDIPDLNPQQTNGGISLFSSVNVADLEGDTKTDSGPKATKADCNLPPKNGMCRALFPKWYYKPSDKKCLKFDYGGCGGNLNNFETQEECMKLCG